MVSTLLRRTLGVAALGAGLLLAGVAGAGVISVLEFRGKVMNGADMVPPETSISAFLTFETLRDPLSVDISLPDAAGNRSITQTIDYTGLEVFFDGELFGANRGGLIIERDGNGIVTDTYSAQGTPLANGPWLTDTINFSFASDTVIEFDLPNGIRLAGVAALSLSPHMTISNQFAGAVGEFAMGFGNGRVLRAVLDEVRGGPLSTISEPMTLLLSAVGFAAVGLLARRSRRRA